MGVRFTINSYNYDQLEDIFHLIKEEKINRVCFYHLVYSGRGSEMMKEDTSHAQSRKYGALKTTKDKDVLIYMDESLHGRTMGSLSVTGGVFTWMRE
ncbi:hypothetical protein KTC96_04310 [Clostridium estertheticum]|nr:hypothetical protein [Clostridium estertheticum]MBX4261838.1 hypothetical protein [Clostridium estertheticum]WLC71262.1 hypothetical protein KTC96_04310 [Clostridium estertheticum]